MQGREELFFNRELKIEAYLSYLVIERHVMEFNRGQTPIKKQLKGSETLTWLKQFHLETVVDFVFTVTEIGDFQ